MAVAKAVSDKAQLELLDLDGNEISDSAIDDIKVHQVCVHHRDFDIVMLRHACHRSIHCSCSIMPNEAALHLS